MRKHKGLVDNMGISEIKLGDHFFWWPNFIVTTVCYTFGGKISLLLQNQETKLLFFLLCIFLSLVLPFSSSFLVLSFFFFPPFHLPYFHFFLYLQLYFLFLKPLPFLSRLKLRQTGGVVCRCLRTGSNKAFSPSVYRPAGFPHRLSWLQFTLSVWTEDLMMGLNFNDFSKYLSS